jgi:hypothetical protein
MSNNKVTSLTPEQEAKFPEYVKKYLALGLSTHQTTLGEVTPLINELYLAAQLPPPKTIYLVDSPKAAIAKYKELTSCTDKEAKNQISNFGYGSLDAAWLSYYSFFLNEVPEVTGLKSIKGLLGLLGKCSYYLPYDEVCIVSKNPVKIFMDQGREVLHNPHGKSVEYADGFGVYSLFGISVDGKFIETAREDIKAADVLSIDNTEQRYAVMRHIGLDLFADKLNPEIIDEAEGYKLMLLEVEGRRIGPYLQMSCPSTGRVFLEGVGDPTKYEFIDESITNVSKALEWRATQASANFLNKFNLKKQEFHT